MMSDFNELYQKLLSTANDLRREINSVYPDYPEDVVDNINAAIVYLDCARQNVSRHAGQTPGTYKVIIYLESKAR